MYHLQPPQFEGTELVQSLICDLPAGAGTLTLEHRKGKIIMAGYRARAYSPIGWTILNNHGLEGDIIAITCTPAEADGGEKPGEFPEPDLQALTTRGIFRAIGYLPNGAKTIWTSVKSEQPNLFDVAS